MRSWRRLLIAALLALTLPVAVAVARDDHDRGDGGRGERSQGERRDERGWPDYGAGPRTPPRGYYRPGPTAPPYPPAPPSYPGYRGYAPYPSQPAYRPNPPYYQPPRYAPPSGQAYGRWRRGQVLPPAYRGDVIGDYGRYHLRRPPRGYCWVRQGDDFVLVAIATGLIFEVISGGY